MGGRYGQGAAGFVRKLLGNPFDGVCLAQHLSGQFKDDLPCRRDMGQVFAAACKYLHPQFILQQPDLLADSGLGGKQALGSR